MNTLPQRPDPALATAPRNARSADAAAGIKNLQQLIELRWIAVVGQVFTIEMAHYSLGLKLPKPCPPCSASTAFTLLSASAA